jgi:hypothetical protein
MAGTASHERLITGESAAFLRRYGVRRVPGDRFGVE